MLSQKYYLEEYWKGYEYVDELISKDEQLQITCKDVLESQVGDGAHYPSKVRIVDGWNTHPSTEDRIENARQFLESERRIDKTDARTIAPMNIMNSVGKVRQEIIAENMSNPIEWSQVKDIKFVDFLTWTEKLLKERRVPNFLFPFVNKNIVSFALPSAEEMETPVETPFTASNREMLLEFSQGVADWQTLNQLNSDDSEVKRLLYNGTEPANCSIAIEQHRSYLEPFNERIKNLDIQIYKYLWKRAKNKTNLNIMYWALFFGNDGLRAMSDIMNTVNAIRDQAQYYNTYGQGFSLRDDVQAQLTKDFWEFMRSFDYKNVSSFCGDWKNGEEVTVNQLLQKWYDFASKEKTPYLATSELFGMIDEVYPLLDHLYNLGKSQWTERIINAYYDIDETEEPEPEPIEYKDIWDDSLETVSDGEAIRYKIADYYSKLEKGQQFTATDIFGEDAMSADEYTEFLKFVINLNGPGKFNSKEDLENAIIEQSSNPDTSIMMKIGYTYMFGDVVEQDLVESTKWFIKAADENDAEALDRVGGAYRNGSGVEQNFATAVDYYKKSVAADGFADALLDLGLAYLKGEGVPQNAEHGYSLMIRAAKQGNAAAQYNMGYLYRKGIGIEPNMDEAIKWYRLSAAQDYEQAVESLKKLNQEG